MKTPRPRSTEPSAALPDTRVRVVLPPPLCVAGPRSTNWRPATPCCGARSATTLRSGGEPYLRFFACGVDLSLDAPDAPLPEAVPSGREPFPVVGAMAGGGRGSRWRRSTKSGHAFASELVNRLVFCMFAAAGGLLVAPPDRS